MSSNAYSVRNVYRYSRTSYKNDAKSSVNAYKEANVTTNNNAAGIDIPVCRCEMDIKSFADNIIHKKCPIIALANQQRERILDEADRIFFENGARSRSLYDFILFIKDVVTGENRRICAHGLLLVLSFIMGILLGSASCGTHLRKFNSPVFACFDRLLAVDSRKTSEDTAIY